LTILILYVTYTMQNALVQETLVR